MLATLLVDKTLDYKIVYKYLSAILLKGERCNVSNKYHRRECSLWAR